MKHAHLWIMPLLLLGTGSIEAGDRIGYFPQNYVQARQTFRALTSEDKMPRAVHGLFRVPSSTDPDLTVDWVHLPALKQPKTLIVLFSGVHGPEAYAGSAVQRLFLEEILPEMDRASVGVFLAHSLNPFGFKNNRRVTENNVDLNRNFGLETALYQTPNVKYADFLDLLAPPEQVGGMFFPFLRTVSRIGWELISGHATRAELTEVIESGQYQFPNSIEYGGAAAEPQTLAMINVLKKEAQSYARVVFIDLHTGLGEKGVLHLMIGNEFERASPTLVKSLVTEHPDKTAFEFTTRETVGFYPVHGDSVDVIPFLFPQKEVLALTAEFGTLGKSLPKQLDSLERLIQENQGFHHGYATAELKQKVEARFLELFYPHQDAEWKRLVIDRGYRLLNGFVKKCPTLE